VRQWECLDHLFQGTVHRRVADMLEQLDGSGLQCNARTIAAGLHLEMNRHCHPSVGLEWHVIVIAGI